MLVQQNPQGSDYDLKFEKAKEYYEKNQCYRSLPLLMN